MGECVLSQDAESGEIAFKPVVLTTRRPPSPVLQIRAGGTTVRSTRGHPMWVCGRGWQMAKELKVGQWLHTINGPVQIVSVEPDGEAPCYNLVVADFDTYFVGDDKVLVHDNNIRNAVAATVPGFADP
jgi:Pretoxin HINT domain